MLLESQNMVPDCQRRILAAFEDLKSLMVSQSYQSALSPTGAGDTPRYAVFSRDFCSYMMHYLTISWVASACHK